LIEDQFIVGITAVAERHDEEINPPALTVDLEAPDLAKVDLRFFTRFEVKASVNFGLFPSKAPRQTLDGFIRDLEIRDFVEKILINLGVGKTLENLGFDKFCMRIEFAFGPVANGLGLSSGDALFVFTNSARVNPKTASNGLLGNGLFK
jgi:hypothetical protein